MLAPTSLASLLRGLSFLLALSLGNQLFAQGVEFMRSNYTKSESMVPMRDGVKLFTTVYAPKDTSRTYPLLMIRTQSGVRPYGADQFPNDLGPSPLFAKAGYIFVYQDIRGRWMSEGTFENMRPHLAVKSTSRDIDESTDTFDTIDWLLKNVPNHNGRAGLYGTSYRGFFVAAGMIGAHPALKAASPQAPIMDWFIGDDWRHNGATMLTHVFFYMPLIGKPRPERHQTAPTLPDYGTPDAYDFFLRLGPLANVDERYFKGQVPYWQEFLKHSTYDDFWKARNLRPHLKQIRPAVLNVGGWYDAENLFGPLKAYHHIEDHSPGATNTLVMGPWIHGGWNRGQDEGASLGDISFQSKTAEFYREKIELPFFEFYLKDQGKFQPAEAVMFQTGTNRWREFPRWPPEGTKEFPLYLHERGQLTQTAPANSVAEASDTYLSDPAKPVPYSDKIGFRLMTDFMIGDQRFASRRPDVLSYETEPLSEEVTLVGPLTADLHVSTTGSDSDWIVKLVDVYPSNHPDPTPNPRGVRLGGYQQLVRGEVMRGRFRNSFERPEPFVPAQPTPVKFQLLDVCHTFRRGHKIQVQIQSSWFPLVDRNPQTFVEFDQAKESDFQPATQRIYRSAEHPSRLIGNRLP